MTDAISSAGEPALSFDMAAIAARLRDFGAPFAQLQADELSVMRGGGLTHDHLIIGNSGYLLRVPRYNQLGMEPVAYIEQQAEIYQRAAQSGHTPELLGTLQPDAALASGALIVQKIEGRRVELPKDWKSIADCLSAIHKVPVPPAAEAAPLPFAHGVFDSQRGLIKMLQQSTLNNARGVPSRSRVLLMQALDDLNADLSRLHGAGRLPITLIGGDSHIGNYLIDKDGKGWLVDLEFAGYDCPLIDLADAGLAITGHLDPKMRAVDDPTLKSRFYARWRDGQHGTDPKLLADFMPIAERLVKMRTVLWLVDWQSRGRHENAEKIPAATRANWDHMASVCLRPEYLENWLKPKARPVTVAKLD